ncbi:hypothetical protein I5P86_05485 [Pseudomonas glycinae]|uniref:hypothetical protein n=1 Tax=Pseudomonas glycinae TaxID=1785145 RepID=UPI0018D5D6F5|nr:hypothetical protein [Pseudomonas glycinae]MBH3404499.1 hypothetical protein [Pseudomonas glycinae]
MFGKYPEQKQSRTLQGALGAALLTLGVFLVVIDTTGGFIFVVAGGGLVMIAWVANERTFARVLRALNWF